jgi:hypothetical protein
VGLTKSLSTETFKNREKLLRLMKFTKKGQLGVIEFKYFIVGLIIGIIISLVSVFLGTKGILPFKIPLVCG